jgi:hypothetical protein
MRMISSLMAKFHHTPDCQNAILRKRNHILDCPNMMWDAQGDRVMIFELKQSRYSAINRSRLRGCWAGAASCMSVGLVFSVLACGSSTGSNNPNNTSGKNGSGNGGSSGSNPNSGSEGGTGVGTPANGMGGGTPNGTGSSGRNGGSGGSQTPDAAAGQSQREGGSEAGSASDAGSSSDANVMASGDAANDGSAAGGTCTRDSLSSAISAYFTALAAHDPTQAPIAQSAKYTENGQVLQLGNGEWQTAQAVKFKRSALDTQSCMSVTESVIGDSSGDLVYGLRLKLDTGMITEIETIPVIAGSYITISASGLINTGMDDWETPIGTADLTPRDQMQSLMDVYFTQFPNGACNFASDCMRVEDGASIGPCTGSGVACNPSSGGSPVMTARLHVIDYEAGISVGFTMFAGQYTDFHMFKVRAGQVHGVHAVLAQASSSGWN